LTAIISLIIRAPPQNCDRHQLLSLLKTPLAFGTPAEKDWKSPSAEISGQCNNDVAGQIQPLIRLERIWLMIEDTMTLFDFLQQDERRD
jgi:hypothetical protein